MNPLGATVLITGANRGIGSALVDAFLEAGAARVYAASRSPSVVPKDPRVIPLGLDVTDPEKVRYAATVAPDAQVLVNNAGIALLQPLLGTEDPAAVEREMSVNFFGTLAMCRAFAPILGRNGGGAIVNVLSILSRVAMPRLGSYSASKAAAYSLTQSLRAELAGQGTLVMGVMPGFVDTDMTKAVTTSKISPQAVAAAVIAALPTGAEDVYPGPAADIAARLLQDPKSVERALASR